MNILGKLIIIGGAVDKGSFTETDLDKNATSNLNFFETGILKRILNESKHKENSRIEAFTKTFNELKPYDGFSGAIAIDNEGNMFHQDSHPSMVFASFDGTNFEVFD